jgi:PIN domain nuclease of toxin-antitoxin system
MKYLLDTHSLIWFLSDDERLSKSALSLMTGDNDFWVSAASLWEMSIKSSIGKLHMARPFDEMFPAQLEANDIRMLNITMEHIKAVAALPFHHRDPFDRLLISQAQVEAMPLISVDAAFDLYGIIRKW